MFRLYRVQGKRQIISDVIIIISTVQMTLRRGYYKHALRQMANLFNKVFLCVKRHATMFVQIYANPFIGERIMNIQKWEVLRNVPFEPMSLC